jgi:hypothetical protein
LLLGENESNLFGRIANSFNFFASRAASSSDFALPIRVPIIGLPSVVPSVLVSFSDLESPLVLFLIFFVVI